MYLNRKINSPKYAGSGPLALHNLTREFLFLSQNARTRHAAESCIDVLRAANALLGYDCYSWQNTDASHSTFQDMKCSSSHTLVLSGGSFNITAASQTAVLQWSVGDLSAAGGLTITDSMSISGGAHRFFA